MRIHWDCDILQNLYSHLAVIAAPIYNLFRKGKHFVWNSECQLAMDTLKRRLTESRYLSLSIYHLRHFELLSMSMQHPQSDGTRSFHSIKPMVRYIQQGTKVEYGQI